MDLDWCLSCDRRIESGSSLYCSPECRSYAQPSTSSRQPHETDHATILAWVHAIPTNSAAGAPSNPFAPPEPTLFKHTFSRPPTPPRLLKRSAQALPTLGVSTPACAYRSHHTNAPRSIATPPPPSVGASTSLSSLLTDSAPATPSDVPSHPNVFGALASHVKSWVATPVPPPHHHHHHFQSGSIVDEKESRQTFPSCRQRALPRAHVPCRMRDDDLDGWDTDSTRHLGGDYWEETVQPRGRDLSAVRERGRRSSRAIL